MELTLTLTACFFAIGSGALVYLVTRHLQAMKNAVSDSEYVPAADRYRPMLRLLSEDEFAFLQTGGWTRQKIRQVRAERRALFRQYLRSLVKDYSRLLAGLRRILVDSDVDRPELSRAMARSQAMFTWGLFRIELFLALHALGVQHVDVSGLVGLMEDLRQRSATLLQPQMAAAAAL